MQFHYISDFYFLLYVQLGPEDNDRFYNFAFIHPHNEL